MIGEIDKNPSFSYTLLFIGALTVLATILRVIGINSGLWLDEITTLIDFARRDFPEMLVQYSNNNHPLYSLLAHISLEILGEQPWSLRLPALLFGVASIPMLYVLGAQVTSKLEALLAAALLAFSYHHIWFSQNARGYTALAFWSLLSSFLLLKGLRYDRMLWYVGYGMAAALGVYTHLSMGFFILAQFILAICPTMRGANAPALVNWRLPATGFLFAAILPLLLYAPLLPQMFQVFTRPSPLRNIATHDWAFLQILHGLKVGFGTWGAPVGLFLLACGARDYFRQNRFVLTLSVLTAALTAAGTFILRLPMQPRFFFILIGFASLIAVRGAIVLGNWVARKWRTVSGLTLNSRSVGISLAGAMILANAMSLGYLYRYPKQDYAGAMRYLETYRSPEEPVIVAPKSLRDYYGKDWLTVENKDELPTPESGRAWILYTLPQYLRPMLVNSIRQKCPQVVAFHGTLSGGDVFVCATPPKMPNTKQVNGNLSVD